MGELRANGWTCNNSDSTDLRKIEDSWTRQQHMGAEYLQWLNGDFADNFTSPVGVSSPEGRGRAKGLPMGLAKTVSSFSSVQQNGARASTSATVPSLSEKPHSHRRR